LYREIIAVCSEIHTKHINTLCGQNVELLNVKPSGTYSDQWAWKWQFPFTTAVTASYTPGQGGLSVNTAVSTKQAPKHNKRCTPWRTALFTLSM